MRKFKNTRRTDVKKDAPRSNRAGKTVGVAVSFVAAAGLAGCDVSVDNSKSKVERVSLGGPLTFRDVDEAVKYIEDILGDEQKINILLRDRKVKLSQEDIEKAKKYFVELRKMAEGIVNVDPVTNARHPIPPYLIRVDYGLDAVHGDAAEALRVVDKILEVAIDIKTHGEDYTEMKAPAPEENTIEWLRKNSEKTWEEGRVEVAEFVDHAIEAAGKPIVLEPGAVLEFGKSATFPKIKILEVKENTVIADVTVPFCSVTPSEIMTIFSATIKRVELQRDDVQNLVNNMNRKDFEPTEEEIMALPTILEDATRGMSTVGEFILRMVKIEHIGDDFTFVLHGSSMKVVSQNENEIVLRVKDEGGKQRTVTLGRDVDMNLEVITEKVGSVTIPMRLEVIGERKGKVTFRMGVPK